jgi:hypothetical protein
MNNTWIWSRVSVTSALHTRKITNNRASEALSTGVNVLGQHTLLSISTPGIETNVTMVSFQLQNASNSHATSSQ